MGQELFKTTGEFTPDKLIADNAIQITTKGIRVASGQGILKRGTLLGEENGLYKMTGSQAVGSGENAGSKTVESGEDAEGKTAGSEEDAGKTVGCDCILTDDVDTSAGDVVAAAYVTGTFNRAAVITAEGTKVETYETELRRLGIFLKGVQEY